MCTIGKHECGLILNCYSGLSVVLLSHLDIITSTCNKWSAPFSDNTSAAFSYDSHFPLPLLLPPTLPALLRSHRRDCLLCSLKCIYSQVIFHDTIVLLSEAMDHCSCFFLYIWQWHLFPVKINPPWLSWLCFLYCSSILWDPAALCTLPHPCRDASGTTTSVQLWMLWEKGKKENN